MVNDRQRVDGSMPWISRTSRSSEVEVANKMRVVGQLIRRLPVFHDDPRPADLEVVVVLGVDRCHGLGVPHLCEVLDRRCSRFARVVPALEGGDHDRVAQLR